MEINVNKSLKTILIVLAVVVVALSSFSGGFFVGHLMPLGGQLSRYTGFSSQPDRICCTKFSDP